MKYILIILLLLISCSDGYKDPRQHKNVAEEIKPYVQRFEAYLGYNIKDIPIQFVHDLQNENDEYIVGVCKEYIRINLLLQFKVFREIEIDRNMWFGWGLSDQQKEILIFHELGHCVLNKRHSEDLDNGCPISIMYPRIFNNWQINNCYMQKYNYYINELFK